MARKTNTDFRLALNRQELIAASQLFGKSEKSAKKSNTKNLEKFVTKHLAGKSIPVPQLSDMQKRDIKDSTKDFGLHEGLHMLSYRIKKITGNHDETNYLRLTLARHFTSYYDELVTNENIDYLISKLPMLTKDELVSGVEKHDLYYQNLFVDYADELKREKEKKDSKENSTLKAS